MARAKSKTKTKPKAKAKPKPKAKPKAKAKAKPKAKPKAKAKPTKKPKQAKPAVFDFFAEMTNNPALAAGMEVMRQTTAIVQQLAQLDGVASGDDAVAVRGKPNPALIVRLVREDAELEATIRLIAIAAGMTDRPVEFDVKGKRPRFPAGDVPDDIRVAIANAPDAKLPASRDELLASIVACIRCRIPIRSTTRRHSPPATRTSAACPTCRRDSNGPRRTARHLPFVAQINLDLAHTKALDRRGVLPSRGMLYLFCAADEDSIASYYMDGSEGDVKVIYVADTSALAPATVPDGIEPLAACPLVLGSGYAVVNPNLTYDDKRTVATLIGDCPSFGDGLHLMLGTPRIFHSGYGDYFGVDEELLFQIPTYDFGVDGYGGETIYAAVPRAALAVGSVDDARYLALPP